MLREFPSPDRQLPSIYLHYHVNPVMIALMTVETRAHATSRRLRAARKLFSGRWRVSRGPESARTQAQPSNCGSHPVVRPPEALWLILILLLGAWLRFGGLGDRSLWLDEFCTWHVSRMELGESLRWAPELTKPPLYQFTLRVLSSDPRPSERVLRFPAALAGTLTIVAGWWLGRAGGGRVIGLALAALLACNVAQIDASQQARSYTMLVLGCTVSIGLWHRLVAGGRRCYLVVYIVSTALTFHAHYLTVLTLAAQACWWIVVRVGAPGERRLWRPLWALIMTGVLCVPMALHYLRYQSSIFQGLDWIPPATADRAYGILARLTFGDLWVLVLLVPALALWVLAMCGVRLPRPDESAERPSAEVPTAHGGAGSSRSPWPFVSSVAALPIRGDLCVLLGIWLVFAWGGLLAISWLAQPALVPRYALPAALPALLIPLVVAHRVDQRAPLAIMAVGMAVGISQWQARAGEPHFGQRELSMFLNENVDPDTSAVVLAIDGTAPTEWADTERLGFCYYPLEDLPLYELPIQVPSGAESAAAVASPPGGRRGLLPPPRGPAATLSDPRTLYVVVFRADPLPAIKAAGRRLLPFRVGDESYSQLLFPPHRLMRVASLLPGLQDPDG
jgi:hypothetical protein